MLQSPVDSDLILFQGVGRLSWVSNDCGKTILLIDHGRKALRFSFHPDLTMYILGLFEPLNCRSKKCRSSGELALSTDWGKSWKVVQKNILDFSWTHSKKFIDRIVVLRKKPEVDKLSPLVITSTTTAIKELPFQVLYSDNHFVTERILRDGAERFAITTHYIFVSFKDPLAAIGGPKRLQLSVGDIDSPLISLSPVELPGSILESHSYTILESTQQRVFLHVTHSISGLQYGHIYVSNSWGRKFDLSLEFNVKNQFGYCDFDRINALENFYIANHYEEDSLRLARYQIEASQRENIKDNDVSDLLVKKTKITFNKGRTWYPITPPKGKLILIRRRRVRTKRRLYIASEFSECDSSRTDYQHKISSWLAHRHWKRGSQLEEGGDQHLH